MQKAPETFFNIDQFLPSLRQKLEQPPFDPKKLLRVAVPVRQPEPNRPLVADIHNRNRLGLTDGNEFWDWEADSLRALFRGDKRPPVLGDYPEAYNECFLLLDLHVLEISGIIGDRRDSEMKEIYSWLRRRPDGKSLGLVHDYMWQAAALILALRPLSQAEFEAIMARLERSCRTFEQGPTSRNYVTTLRNTVGKGFGHNAPTSRSLN